MEICDFMAANYGAHIAAERGQMTFLRKRNAIFSLCITLLALLASFLAPILQDYKLYASVGALEENDKAPIMLAVSTTVLEEPDATAFNEENHQVPEPDSLLLIGLGIIGLAIVVSKGKIRK
jgi:hypothetical protein